VGIDKIGALDAWRSRGKNISKCAAKNAKDAKKCKRKMTEAHDPLTFGDLGVLGGLLLVSPVNRLKRAW
jgi:hypothetical protein